MPRVNHFDIHADDPDRAIQFYERVFGWRFTKLPGPMPYWFCHTGPDSEPGIHGGLTKRMGDGPGDAVVSYVCNVNVDDVEKYQKKVALHGGTIIVPRMAVPGVGWLGYCKDTEGNIFGLGSNDANAR